MRNGRGRHWHSDRVLVCPIAFCFALILPACASMRVCVSAKLLRKRNLMLAFLYFSVGARCTHLSASRMRRAFVCCVCACFDCRFCLYKYRKLAADTSEGRQKTPHRHWYEDHWPFDSSIFPFRLGPPSSTTQRDKERAPTLPSSSPSIFTIIDRMLSHSLHFLDFLAYPYPWEKCLSAIR